ncbi:hypothetical protein ADK55_22210, partial [Streptomyces sp. WM4235]
MAEELCLRAAELELGEGVACGVASTGDPIGLGKSSRRLFRLRGPPPYQANAARPPPPPSRPLSGPGGGAQARPGTRPRPPAASCAAPASRTTAVSRPATTGWGDRAAFALYWA